MVGLLASPASAADAVVAKRVVRVDSGGPNLLRPNAWQPWQAGFQVEDAVLVCDNGSDGEAQRGASQHVVLNQTRPEPIVATVASRAEGVTGSPDNDYALYLDLIYADDTQLVGTGCHVRYGFTRVADTPGRDCAGEAGPCAHDASAAARHGGKAWFRDPALARARHAGGSDPF